MLRVGSHPSHNIQVFRLLQPSACARAARCGEPNGRRTCPGPWAEAAEPRRRIQTRSPPAQAGRCPALTVLGLAARFKFSTRVCSSYTLSWAGRAPTDAAYRDVFKLSKLAMPTWTVIEPDTVGRQFGPYLWRPCGVT